MNHNWSPSQRQPIAEPQLDRLCMQQCKWVRNDWVSVIWSQLHIKKRHDATIVQFSHHIQCNSLYQHPPALPHLRPPSIACSDGLNFNPYDMVQLTGVNQSGTTCYLHHVHTLHATCLTWSCCLHCIDSSATLCLLFSQLLKLLPIAPFITTLLSPVPNQRTYPSILACDLRSNTGITFIQCLAYQSMWSSMQGSGLFGFTSGAMT